MIYNQICKHSLVLRQRLSRKLHSVSNRTYYSRENESRKKNFAVLVDAENVSQKYMESILQDIHDKRGDAIVRRMYGNFSILGESWRSLEADHRFAKICTTRLTKRKSDTADFYLMMDAMKLLYTEPNIEGFVIVTSDSDFVPLVKELQQHDKLVVGYGHEQILAPLRNACNTFICVKTLLNNNNTVQEQNSREENTLLPVDVNECGIANVDLKTNITVGDQPVLKVKSRKNALIPRFVLENLHGVVAKVARGDGWSMVKEIKEHMANAPPELTVHHYGYNTYNEFFVHLPEEFQYRVRKRSGKGKQERRFVKSLC